MARKIHPVRVIDLFEAAPGRYPIQIKFGPERELLLLSSDKRTWFDQETRQASSPPFVYNVECDCGGGWYRALTTAPCERRYHCVQPLPGGRWLLAEFRVASAEGKNGDIYGSDPLPLNSLLIGYGIDDFHTTTDGHIWVCYFDEGIYGGGDVEHSGLVSLDASGAVRFRFWNDIAQSERVPPIDDCYALNVVNDSEVWTTYYSDFPIVRLRNRQLDRAWLDFPKRAARAMAVFKDRLLMARAYEKDEPMVLVDLIKRTVEQVDPVDDVGEQLDIGYVFARGPLICAEPLGSNRSGKLYMFDLTQID